MSIIKYCLVACGVVFAAAAWSFVDAATNTKYMCIDNSDAYITASRALDWGQVLSGLSTIVLTLSISISSRPDKKSNIDNWASATAAFTGIVIACNVLLSGTVCQSQTCLSSSSYKEANEMSDTVPFITEVHNMIGDNTGMISSNNWPCGGRLNPQFFTAPKNYCEETIREYCNILESPGQPYRCLVYTCSDIIPGATARYTLSMVALVTQLIICALIALHEVQPGYELLQGDDEKGDTSTSDIALNASGLRQRRKPDTMFYSEKSKPIAF